MHNPAATVLSSSPPGGASVLSDGQANAGWYMTTGVLPTVVAGDDSASLARSRSQRSKAGASAISPASPKHNRNSGVPQQMSTLARSPAALGSQRTQGRESTIPELSPATERKYDQIYQATGLPDTTHNATSPLAQQQQQQYQLPALNAIRGTQPTTQQYSSRDVIPERQPDGLPLAVAAAAESAQAHRRRLSGSSPRLAQQQQFSAIPIVPGQNQAYAQPQSQTQAGKLDTTTPAIAEMERRQREGPSPLQDYDPTSPLAQSRFTEEMDLVGRTSEDTTRLPYFANSTNGANLDRTSGAPFSDLNPPAGEHRAGDALPASEIARQRGALPDQISRQEHEGLPSREAVQANPALAVSAASKAGQGEQMPQYPVGMSSYHRQPLAPAGAATAGNQITPEKKSRGGLPVLPIQRERDTALAFDRQPIPAEPGFTTVRPVAVNGDADPLAKQAEQQQQSAPSLGDRGATTIVPVLVTSGPMHTSPTGPREMREPTTSPTRAPAVSALPAPQTMRIPTHGPELQTSRTAEPQRRVIGTEKKRFTDTPAPRLPYGFATSPSAADRALSILPSGLTGAGAPSAASSAPVQKQEGVFGNVASKIPHYMFVTYEAHVCQECVNSDKRLHELQHGGQGWRYEYKDSPEERDLPIPESSGADADGKELVRRTGRKDYQDQVSLLPSASQRANGEPCQCDECLKNRATVKYAAENGLIEKIFEGRRHPASEVIETITYTTIVRAPIIEETIETVWCEERNCRECAKKDEEHRANEYRRLAESYPGAVVHETGPSAAYEKATGAKNLWGLTGEEYEGEQVQGEDIMAGKKRGLGNLLSRAGNPRYNELRGIQSSTSGRIVGGEEALGVTERKTSGTVPDWLRGSKDFENYEAQTANVGGLDYEHVRRTLKHDDPEVPFSNQQGERRDSGQL